MSALDFIKVDKEEIFVLTETYDDGFTDIIAAFRNLKDARETMLERRANGRQIEITSIYLR